MNPYHKIQTVFKRNPDNKFRTLLRGAYSLPEFAFLADNEWVFTEKVDGTNIRIKCADKITFGGKTDKAQIPAFLVEKLEERFHSQATRDKIAGLFSDGACLYGEGYGAKIQKGGSNYRTDQDFVLFDVRVGEYWLQREDVEQVAACLEIDVVPIIGTGTLHRMVYNVKAGFASRWGHFRAEGIVARPATELKTRSGHQIITKIKHKDFG